MYVCTTHMTLIFAQNYRSVPYNEKYCLLELRNAQPNITACRAHHRDPPFAVGCIAQPFP